MSAPTLKGFGASDVIAAERALRVTFGEKYGINPDSLFGYWWPRVMEKLGPVARVIPLTADSKVPAVVSGATIATIDVVNKVGRSGADLVLAIQTAASGNFVELREVELLSPAAKAAATKPEGAAARDAVAKEATAKEEANSITRKIAESLGVTAKVASLIAVAIILVIVWYFIPKSSRA